MHILQHHLEDVEGARLGRLDFGAESLDEILVDDAVGGGKKREHMRDKFALVVIEIFPVADILVELHFFDNPVSVLRLLVERQNVGIFERLAERIVVEQRLVWRRLQSSKIV